MRHLAWHGSRRNVSCASDRQGLPGSWVYAKMFLIFLYVVSSVMYMGFRGSLNRSLGCGCWLNNWQFSELWHKTPAFWYLFGELAPRYGVSRVEYMALSWWEKWVKLGCVEWLQTHSSGLLASKSVSFVQTPLCHEQSVIKVGKCLGITEFFIAIPTETLWAFL